MSKNSEAVKRWYGKLTPEQKKERQRGNSRRYYLRYRDKAKQHRKDYRTEMRQRVFDHYGQVCTCCGETKWEFLTVDHINGNGAEHRREINQRSIYIWLVKNGFPAGFRILCFNCNCSLGFRGYCPHQKEKV